MIGYVTLGTNDFTRGVGLWLPRLAYEPGSPSCIGEREKSDLFTLARRWIRGHRRGADPGRS